MSGFIGNSSNVIKKIKRGWIEVVDKSQILWESIAMPEEVENGGIVDILTNLVPTQYLQVLNQDTTYGDNLYCKADNSEYTQLRLYSFTNIGPYIVGYTPTIEYYEKVGDVYNKITESVNTRVSGGPSGPSITEYYYDIIKSSGISSDVYFKFDDATDYVLLNSDTHVNLGPYDSNTKTWKFYDGQEERVKSETRTEGSRPVFGSKRMTIKSAWVGTSEGNKRILNKEAYYIYNSNMNLPYEFTNGGAVVYNNKIHILGGFGYTTNHYSWDGDIDHPWTNESVLPYGFQNGSVVVYNNKIHILGSEASGYTYHYSWNGTSWTQESTLPYNFANGGAVVYNNKIHILGSSYTGTNTNHYSWNGTSWTQESILPYDFKYGVALVRDGELCILGGMDHESEYYIYENGTWIDQGNGSTPGLWLSPLREDCPAVVYDRYTDWKTIGLLGCGSSGIKHVEIINGSTSMELYKADMPYNSQGASAVVFNRCIYLLGGTNNPYAYYIYKGADVDKWENDNSIPYAFSKGQSVVYNGKINILGGEDTKNPFHHYSLNVDRSWTKESDLPYDFYDGCAAVYNNQLHILGGRTRAGTSVTAYVKSHKYLNNGVWTSLSDLPFSCYQSAIVVYDNKLHVLGGYYDHYQHYSWDGTSWTKESNLNTDGSSSTAKELMGCRLASAVVFNNDIYLLGGLTENDSRSGPTRIRRIYYDNSEGRYVTDMNSGIPFDFVRGSAIVYDGKLHVFGSNYDTYENDAPYKHYSWNGVNPGVWKKEWDIPYKFGSGRAELIDDEILLLGGGWSLYTMLKTNENNIFE